MGAVLGWPGESRGKVVCAGALGKVTGTPDCPQTLPCHLAEGQWREWILSGRS